MRSVLPLENRPGLSSESMEVIDLQIGVTVPYYSKQFSKGAWHPIPKQRAHIPGLSFKHPYWQILTGAPEILKPGYMSQSSSHVVIIWLFWSLPVQLSSKCSQPASYIFWRLFLGK